MILVAKSTKGQHVFINTRLLAGWIVDENGMLHLIGSAFRFDKDEAAWLELNLLAAFSEPQMVQDARWSKGASDTLPDDFASPSIPKATE